MNKVKRVAILFGGKSVEHEVSVRSALNVASFLDKGLFETVLIGITKSGDWYLCNEVSKEIQLGVPVSIELKGTTQHLLPMAKKLTSTLFSRYCMVPMGKMVVFRGFSRFWENLW